MEFPGRIVMNARTRVLIVDDEPIVGERLKASLERAGFCVDAFFSSLEALERLGQESYDILVTDLKMKHPDGLELLRAAKQRQPGIRSGGHYRLCDAGDGPGSALRRSRAFHCETF